ncbi:hypothetical protein [Nocardioides sp. InS609-2]|uniref:hypothetical protein n=1 Tax=Nocardioides sp. InS609-2 TaxID=2760705 RepID=UPI0020C0C241|nr:hypothetical protein [Nocardioides sp. InS609-2]
MIETLVEGSTASVDSAAFWLRDLLKARVDEASDDVIAAKHAAGHGWEGESGDAYVAYTKDIVKVTDEHVDRIERAAGKFDSYSGKLKAIQDRMRDLRGEATAGGLTVRGTEIQEPEPARSPGVPTGELTADQQNQYDADLAAYDDQAARIKLYNRILGDVEGEWTQFVDWVDSNLSPVTKSLEAPALEKLISFVKENAGNLAIGYSLTHGERAMKSKSGALVKEAKELRSARRSGNPARRAVGIAPETPGRIRNLTSRADWLGKGGKVLGPLGGAIEVWNGLESESPAGGVIAAGVGIAATAAIIATAPVSVPAIVVVGGAVAVGAGATWLATEGWDALPDGWTEPADEWVGDRWDDTKDVVSDGWDTVTGWF